MKADIKITQKGGTVNGEYTVEVNGVDISNQVRAVDVSLEVQEFPVVTVHYACVSLEVVGGFEVQHVCPFGDDADE